ncbi:MAG TPA: cytosine deaminase [Bauldia sp.]|nr:cytosine deaminase [Bauldia sp.]
MTKGFAAIPRGGSYVLSNARLPATLVDGFAAKADADGLVRASITIADRKVARIDAPGRRSTLPKFDMDGGMVWPCFIDMHTHLDKGHIWPRQANPDGTFAGALDAVEKDRRAKWKKADVAARMDFAIRCAYAHGTALIRTHLDSAAPQHRISWPLFAEMRDKWAGKVALQAVSIVGIDAFRDEKYADKLADLIADVGGTLGAVTYPLPDLDRLLEGVMLRAANRNLDLDFHVDETGDPGVNTLRVIADTALRTDFPGTIVAGHCCSLATQDTGEADATMDRVAEAGMAVVSLPMCNMYLQGRDGERDTPHWRGVTLVHELAERGVPVSVASDNTRDPFYAYGDLDMLEVFREATRILHLDHPFADWPAVVARTPATVVRRPEFGVIKAGASADLVLFRGRSFTELLARPQMDRTVLRHGKAIDTTLPDYRELDAVVGGRR